MKRRERGRGILMCGCLSHTPFWGPGPQPRRVSWLGIKPVTLWFAGQHSIHWATPARAEMAFLRNIDNSISIRWLSFDTEVPSYFPLITGSEIFKISLFNLLCKTVSIEYWLIPLLGVYPKKPETPIWKNRCAPRFIAAYLQQPRCGNSPSVDQ